MILNCNAGQVICWIGQVWVCDDEIDIILSDVQVIQIVGDVGFVGLVDLVVVVIIGQYFDFLGILIVVL